jgi:glycosyltransferase involved in cell wall biosynthesis
MIALVFWCSVTFVFYAYFGYGCALAALAQVRRRPVLREPIAPRVTVIIAAHNEERHIRSKIENTLRQDYPSASLEIIVASDCSSDATDAIAGEYAPRVRLVRCRERRGKEGAQQLAVEEASGEILIFSDVGTWLAPDGVSGIVRNFADPGVGCVSSTDRFVDGDGSTSGEGAYVRYEMFLRALESRVNSLVGLSGSFFAARRDVCRRWTAHLQSDFDMLLCAVDMGMRGVLDVDSAGYYANLADDRREVQRKVRIVLRGISVLAENRRMLNPFRYGLFAWQLASHKLCRWLVPFFLIIAALANALLVSRSAVYRSTFVLQVAFYAAAVAGTWSRARALRLPAFMVSSNLAVLRAWVRYARGDRITTWDPSKRLAGLFPAAGNQPAATRS